VLTVNVSTSATPLPSAPIVKNPGGSITFSTVASGGAPFTYVWTQNGTAISGQTRSSLALTNLAYADAGSYSVVVGGACGSVTQGPAVLIINHPPVVSIVSPTNGTVFMAPASFTVFANAFDPDGSVTNVEFFRAGFKVGETNQASYSIIYSIGQLSLPAGNYAFTARATDNFGAQGLSGPVSVTVLDRPPLTIVSAMHLNRQSGLFEQTVRVTNPTYSVFNAVRVLVYNLTSDMHVYNASGSTNGVPYVQSQAAIAPGSYIDFVIEYYVTSSATPNPTLVAQLVTPVSGGGVTVVGTPQPINRILMLPNKTAMIEFASVLGRVYYVQYSSDTKVWQTAEPSITGTGTWIQWIDNGPPKTSSPPASTPVRFYRVIWVQ
jgi:hypothetical protein